MRVNSEVIPKQAIDSVVEFMQQRENFISAEIRDILANHGVRQCYAAAERIIQKYSKAGNIVFDTYNKRVWNWVQEERNP